MTFCGPLLLRNLALSGFSAFGIRSFLRCCFLCESDCHLVACESSVTRLPSAECAINLFILLHTDLTGPWRQLVPKFSMHDLIPSPSGTLPQSQAVPCRQSGVPLSLAPHDTHRVVRVCLIFDYYPATCGPKGHGSSSAAAEAAAVLLLTCILVRSQTGIAGHSRTDPLSPSPDGVCV